MRNTTDTMVNGEKIKTSPGDWIEERICQHHFFAAYYRRSYPEESNMEKKKHPKLQRKK